MTDTRTPEYTAEQVEAAKTELTDIAGWNGYLPLSNSIRTVLSALSTAESEIHRLTLQVESAERDSFHSGVLSALAVLSDSGRAITNEYEEVVGACGPIVDLLAAAKRLDVLDTSGIALYVRQKARRLNPPSNQGKTNG